MYFEWEGQEMRFGGSMERKDGEEGQEREKKPSEAGRPKAPPKKAAAFLGSGSPPPGGTMPPNPQEARRPAGAANRTPGSLVPGVGTMRGGGGVV